MTNSTPSMDTPRQRFLAKHGLSESAYQRMSRQFARESFPLTTAEQFAYSGLLHSAQMVPDPIDDAEREYVARMSFRAERGLGIGNAIMMACLRVEADPTNADAVASKNALLEAVKSVPFNAPSQEEDRYVAGALEMGRLVRASIASRQGATR